MQPSTSEPGETVNRALKSHPLGRSVSSEAGWRGETDENVIERLFVEVRRRTRPMVCFVHVKSVDRIIYSIFHRFNLEWKNRILQVFTQAACHHPLNRRGCFRARGCAI